MIGQALGDAAGWAWDHPWHLLGGLAAWMTLSLGLALVAGPIIGAAEYQEPDDDVSRWLR